MKTEICIGLSEKEYREHTGLNQSKLKPLIKGVPAACNVDYEAGADCDFGTICHSMIWEPDKFGEGKSHFVRPDEYPSEKKGVITMKKWNGNATWCDEWLTARSSLPVLRATGNLSVEYLERMRDSIYALPEAKETLDWSGDMEVGIFAECPLTGMQLKGRVDKLAGKPGGMRAAVDLKTCVDASKFERVAVDLGYWIQDAFYRRLLKLNGTEARFIFLVVEKSPPFLVRIGELSENQQARNDERLDELLKTYSECSRRNFWPSYRINSDLSRCGLEQFNLFIKD